MGSQHCIGGEGKFEKHFLQFPEYFVTDCLKCTKTKENRWSMHTVSKKANVLYEPDYVTVQSVINPIKHG